MVVLRPFRGWRYDPAVVGDLAAVLSPPYDLVTPGLQESLRQLSPFNVVHLEAGESLDWNASVEGQYSQTATLFDEWSQEGVLRRDQEHCFYLLRQDFQHGGRKRSRLGLTACVQLEEYQGKGVLPHEYTEAPAIRDRVALMEACNTNFSPIMSLYRDAASELASIFGQTMAEAPVIEVEDEQGQQSTLWLITEASAQEKISRFFLDKPIFLADGHHRYEAALQFQRNQSGRGKGSDDDKLGHNFMMMTLIGFDDPGLLVLPYHRVLSGLSTEQQAGFQERLNQIFEAQPLQTTDNRGADALVEQVAYHGLDRHAMAMIGPEGQGPVLLTLREGVRWQQWGPLAVSEAWILEEQVLKPVLGDTTLDHLGFIHDHHEALESVASGTQQIAFLLKPFPMDQFEAIVGDGQRLPRKSTFFYPKLPTGLVINQLAGIL